MPEVYFCRGFPLQIARYRSKNDNAPETQELSWIDLAALLTRHERTPCEPCPGKTCAHKDGPAWSPVEVAPCPPTCRNHGRAKAVDCGGGKFHRLNANVRAVHLAVFDIDHVTETALEGICARVDRAGLAAVLHSSHSSRPPEDCCVRLVIPLSRPVLAAEWPTFRAEIERWLELPADRATKDLARLYFLPTAPQSARVIAAAGDGAVIDVDGTLARVPKKAPPSPAIQPKAPAPAEGEAVELDDLRGRLQALKRRYSAGGRPDDKERAEILGRVLKGEPLAQEGGRDHTLNRACSMIATALHPETPAEAILELVRPSINMMPTEPEGLAAWLDEARDMIERAKDRRAQNDQAKRDWDAEVRTRLARESVTSDYAGDDSGGDDEEGDDPAEPDPATPAATEAPASSGGGLIALASIQYKPEQLEAWASEQGTDVDGFERRWIIQRAKAFYVFVGGRYRPPITKDDLAVSLPRDLARAPISIVAEDKDGNERPLGPGAILDRYATVARNVQASLALQRSFYEAKTETFFEAVCPIRPLKARQHADVHRWLELLGGEHAQRLLDWVAVAPRLDRQACAIYLDGPKGCGKSLLAAGLARLWTCGGPSELGRVLSGFNDVLVTCPLIFADEALPQQRGITAELRRLIGSTSRNLNRKFLPTCNLDGAVRLIIAGNNDRLLDTGEDLSANDLDAVAGRFLYIQAPQTAADYLSSVGGPPTVGRWITEDRIAEHALWLRENRNVNEASRFLVEGVSQEFHQNLATGSGISGLVCEWLVRYLADPNTSNPADPEGKQNLVLAGHGEIWVNAESMVRAQAWEKRVPSVKVPSAAKIGRALRNLSKGSERVKIGERQHKYHRIDPGLLVTWAERSTVVDTEALRARVAGPCELLAKALAERAP
jgi:hypothetical protein